MVGLDLLPLDTEGAKLRYDIVNKALKLIDTEHIVVGDYTDDEIADFLLEWQDLSRTSNSTAKLKLRSLVEGISVLEWVYNHYSLERLYVMYEFSEYCDWLSSREIIQHFGDLVKLFLAIRGPNPEWYSGGYFHRILQYAYRELFKKYKVFLIRKWLNENWELAVNVFEKRQGTLDSFPYLQGIDYQHIHTQYRKLVENRRAKVARRIIRERKAAN